MTATHSRSAFTLMELLIVISIIMILMGLVFVGVRLGREAANKAKTTQNISMLQAALSNYRSTNGHYPDDPVLFDELKDLKDFNAITETQWESVNRKLVIELKKSGASMDDLVKDGWKKALRYRPARLYPYKSATDAKADIDGEEPPARDEFQIWSKGPNDNDEGGGKKPAASDDIVSWPK
jgi:type II secretory pathway pseudopilin PulG